MPNTSITKKRIAKTFKAMLGKKVEINYDQNSNNAENDHHVYMLGTLEDFRLDDRNGKVCACYQLDGKEGYTEFPLELPVEKGFISGLGKVQWLNGDGAWSYFTIKEKKSEQV